MRWCRLLPTAEVMEEDMDEENEEKDENGGREEAVLEGGLLRRAGAGSTDLGRSGAQRRRELTAADIRW